MSIELSSDLERCIDDAISTGRFRSREQLVESAVRALLATVSDAPRASHKRGIMPLDPPLISPAGRRIELTNDQIYELIEFP